MRRRRLLFAAAILASGAVPSRAQMASADRYVVTPDELKKTFTSKHPGPAWMVSHDDVFRLSPAQKDKLEQIEAQSSGKTRSSAEDVKTAYAAFVAAASAQPADQREIARDIDALAKAQVVATKAIVDAHVAAFDVLEGKQKKQFEDLVRCCAPPP